MEAPSNRLLPSMPRFEVEVSLNSIDLFVVKRAININIREKYYCPQFGLRWIK